MKVQLAQISCHDGVTLPNLARVLSVINNASHDTDLIVFPETCLMGFPTIDEVRQVAESVHGPSITAVKEAVAAKGISVAVGFVETENGKCFNTTVLISPNGVELTYRKTHLWSSDIGVFERGDQLATVMWNGIRVGILICFDIEFPESARSLAIQGAELLIVTNGNMDPYGPVHRTLITARAMENQVFAVMANRCGSGAGLVFAGESAVISPSGEVLGSLGRDEGMLVVDIDLTQIKKSRAEYTYLAKRQIPLVGEVVSLQEKQNQTAHRL